MMMKRERQRLMVMICLLACLPTSSYSFAQEGKVAGAPIEGNFVFEMNLLPAGTFKVFGTKFFGKVVKGAPYSATAITEQVQTLGDGNQIIRKNEAKVYRDSEGRTRLDQKLETIGKWTAAGEAPQMIYINDPVTGYSYNLDPRTRTVRKSMNVKTVTLNQRLELRDEKPRKEQEERVREIQQRTKEHEKRVKERAREHEARLKEQTREREMRARERAREQEARVKENEARAKERAREHEEREKEWNREREARLKERTREREKRINEQKERIKEQTIERKERMKLIENKRVKPVQVKTQTLASGKAKTFTYDSPLKIKASMGSKEISNPDARKKIESLGKQIIEGVEVEGTRSTRTIVAGEIGNTLPIEVIDESWHSPDLQVQVMTKHSDPRSGVTTYRLTNISRSEPQRALFEVPADYAFKYEPKGKKTVTKPESPKTPEPMKRSEPSKPVEPMKKPEPPKTPALSL